MDQSSISLVEVSVSAMAKSQLADLMPRSRDNAFGHFHQQREAE
jgi:hypothetical protein